jgi:para-nitrobenzyl esterase
VRFVVVIFLLLAASACASSDAAVGGGSVVRTASGQVRGTVAGDYRLFQGIPYAAPPVGDRRWQPPAAPEPWLGELDATKPAPRCPQEKPADGAATSENCLSLNVWTPKTATRSPVLVWIHGGAFVNGGGDRYDARDLATRGDEVVVTVNYRLGALGFLADPALAPSGEAGNYGLQDQQQALRWVRDNIEAFGGDPGAVTIAGQSAGGMSVCDHLVAPGSRGLFRAAMIQSGPCQAQATLAAAVKSSVDYTGRHGCADRATAAACLRALPVADLLDAPQFFAVAGIGMPGPVVGGSVLPVAPLDGFRRGAAVPVPVVVGTTHDEFTYFLAEQVAATKKPVTPDGYVAALASVFGDGASVASHYPLALFGGDASRAYAAAVTDSGFSCAAQDMATALAARAPVWAYEFNDPTSPAAATIHAPFPLGASHTFELPYLFRFEGQSGQSGAVGPLTPAQQRLSDRMITQWTGFVRSGAPPDWPRFGAVETFRTDGVAVTKAFAADHRCVFWSGFTRH